MNFLRSLILHVALSTIAFNADCSRILGLFPHNGASHFLVFESLMKGLAKRGHQVDVVSHFPQKKPFANYTDVINLSGTIDVLENSVIYKNLKPFLYEKSFAHVIATKLGGDLCDAMDLPKFRELIHDPPQKPPYDILIVEIFGAHCFLALGQHLKVPVVGVVTGPMWPWMNDMVGNPDESAYFPHISSHLSGKLNFWERFENAYEILREKLAFYRHSAYQDEKITKYLGPLAPSVRDSEKEVSLILVNTHFSLNGIRPSTTAVVEVGGLHIPEDTAEENCMGGVSPSRKLQQWMDESTDGFVYMSFGSLTRMESLPGEVLRAIYASSAKLAPVRVLMKIVLPEDSPGGLPHNVLNLPLLPQVAVLKHQNIRAFLTHGGMLGTQEAIYFGVPMIGVPLFADQIQNIKTYVEKNVAVCLHHEQLTEDNLDQAFGAVLNDTTYMRTAKRLSAEFRDRPMSALDTGIFWVEYVIRHGGRSLRSPAVDLEWWEVQLLDVYAVLLLTSLFTVYLLTSFTTYVIKVILRTAGGVTPLVETLVFDGVRNTSLLNVMKTRSSE